MKKFTSMFLLLLPLQSFAAEPAKIECTHSKHVPIQLKKSSQDAAKAIHDCETKGECDSEASINKSSQDVAQAIQDCEKQGKCDNKARDKESFSDMVKRRYSE